MVLGFGPGPLSFLSSLGVVVRLDRRAAALPQSHRGLPPAGNSCRRRGAVARGMDGGAAAVRLIGPVLVIAVVVVEGADEV